MRSSLRSILPTISLAVVVAGFMTADRLWLHWYAPTSDTVARDILGDWDRSRQPEQLKLTGSLEEAPPGSLNQLRQAIHLLAWNEAIVFTSRDVQGKSGPDKANRYRECVAYILARNNIGSACNLVAIQQ